MKPSCQLALSLLRENAEVTTHMFLAAGVGSRFGARLGELRDLGYRIDESRLPLPTRGSRYRLIAEPELPKPSGESRAGIARPDADPCKGVAAPTPARDSSASAYGHCDGALFDVDRFGRAA